MKLFYPSMPPSDGLESETAVGVALFTGTHIQNYDTIGRGNSSGGGTACGICVEYGRSSPENNTNTYGGYSSYKGHGGPDGKGDG
jgi:hypothetical protein